MRAVQAKSGVLTTLNSKPLSLRHQSYYARTISDEICSFIDPDVQLYEAGGKAGGVYGEHGIDF